MDLNVSNFSSYFEIFAVLNLAYAGSEVYRTAIDDEILSLNNTITPNFRQRFTELKSEITVVAAESYETQLQMKVNEVEDFFITTSKKLLEAEEESVKFTTGLKSTFLITALYCLSIILIGGFDQFFEKKSITNGLLFFLHSVLVYNALVFTMTLTNFNKKNIRPITTVSVFLLLSVFPCYCCSYHPVFFERFNLLPPSVNISISLITAISPYLFHFARVYWHKISFRYRMMIIERDTREKLKYIENWIAFPANGALSSVKGGKGGRIVIFFRSLKRGRVQ